MERKRRKRRKRSSLRSSSVPQLYLYVEKIFHLIWNPDSRVNPHSSCPAALFFEKRTVTTGSHIPSCPLGGARIAERCGIPREIYFGSSCFSHVRSVRCTAKWRHGHPKQTNLNYEYLTAYTMGSLFSVRAEHQVWKYAHL